ncbi:uncharacterized protein N7473_010022 [Penicillium subrubescens]|uniref:uncharacterized protein n=1 Tax=Penicillium subrubescens TaxID=1316194 RepID=UPI00254510D0|nr:uncharacterized protein N7473_010022 [Penicillium subrubescens]KAJ5883136.1 hypothetical protein N7473_010022 [Penicillium subrubescens]
MSEQRDMFETHTASELATHEVQISACFAIKGLPVCKVQTYAEKQPSIEEPGFRAYDLRTPIFHISRAGSRREAKEPPSLILKALSREIAAGVYCLGYMIHCPLPFNPYYPLTFEADPDDHCLQSRGG